jgi:hypothetical protein
MLGAGAVLQKHNGGMGCDCALRSNAKLVMPAQKGQPVRCQQITLQHVGCYEGGAALWQPSEGQARQTGRGHRQ